MRRFNNSNFNRRTRGGRRQPRKSGKQLTPNQGKSQPYQKVARWMLPGINNKLTTTALGGIAVATALDPTVNILNWASLQALFDEYRVIKVVVQITPISPSTGSTMFYIDENDSTVPLGTAAVAHKSNQYPNNSSAAIVRTYKGLQFVGYMLTFTPKSFLDADWIDTTQPYKLAYLKAFTDGGFYTSPINTSLWVYRMFFSLEFRGNQ